MNELISLLKSKYGIHASGISSAPGGFSTKAAFRVAGGDGIDYFLKVYDKTLPTTRFFVERIDAYMPVLAWLAASPALSGRVLTPVPLRSGGYKAETRDEVYVLFHYVRGQSPGIEGMTRAQTVDLAGILARLHEAVPPEAPGLEEDISLAFCDRLLIFLDDVDTRQGALPGLIAPHAQMLRGAIGETLRLRDTIRFGYTPLALCHGDAHGNNVIQSERLVLADWEDLRLAPPEADLFIYAWHPYGETLLEAYVAARQGYRINRELLYFYVLRRRIEDVAVDVQRLTEEAPDEGERAELLKWIHRGIDDVRRAYIL